jgi:hypothetical protein
MENQSRFTKMVDYLQKRGYSRLERQKARIYLHPTQKFGFWFWGDDLEWVVPFFPYLEAQGSLRDWKLLADDSREYAFSQMVIDHVKFEEGGI